MNRLLLIAGLLLMIAWGAGCVVIDVDEMKSFRPAADSREATTCEVHR